jgi:transcriptional regulator with XRE-family HTH domain
MCLNLFDSGNEAKYLCWVENNKNKQMVQMETKKIGNKIVEARKKVNISQAQLAKRLFISPQAVGKWERGESMPDIITFNRLAEILGVDLNYFSESFQSAASEMERVELLEKPADLPTGKQNKKLSWDMSRGNWLDADFSGLKNLHEKFSSSNMQRCLFIGSEMSGLLLKSNHVAGCDFSGTDIDSSHIQNSYLVNNLFKNCLLKETEFSGSHINACDFTGADFTRVAVKSSDFSKNTIANAVWKHTSFIATQLADIVFEGTLEDCYFENCAFTRVKFQNATLTDTFFKCKSLKQIQFIDCMVDKMTYAFLKNGKANLTGITLLTSKGGNE